MDLQVTRAFPIWAAQGAVQNQEATGVKRKYKVTNQTQNCYYEKNIVTVMVTIVFTVQQNCKTLFTLGI